MRLCATHGTERVCAPLNSKVKPASVAGKRVWGLINISRPMFSPFFRFIIHQTAHWLLGNAPTLPAVTDYFGRDAATGFQDLSTAAAPGLGPVLSDAVCVVERTKTRFACLHRATDTLLATAFTFTLSHFILGCAAFRRDTRYRALERFTHLTRATTVISRTHVPVHFQNSPRV
jgi:hypothetical protein